MPGPDGLHPHSLKECAASVTETLVLIFSKSFETGLLLADWKMAQLVPIFKKSAKYYTPNYRPVSLSAVSYQ